MKNLPFFQFYPSDFLLDEKVILMPNNAVGCYIKLLSHCWLEGSIPSDMERLAILCSESQDSMEELFELYLSCCFKKNGNTGRLVNPRLELERNKIEQVRQLKSEAGKRGMKSRWDKAFDNTVITEHHQPVITKHNYTDTDTDTDTEKDKEKKKKELPKFELPDWMPDSEWSVFLSHRKSMKAPVTKESYPLFIEKFFRWKANGYAPEFVIGTMVERGWKSFKPEWVKESNPMVAKFGEKGARTVASMQKWLEETKDEE